MFYVKKCAFVLNMHHLEIPSLPNAVILKVLYDTWLFLRIFFLILVPSVVTNFVKLPLMFGNAFSFFCKKFKCVYTQIHTHTHKYIKHIHNFFLHLVHNFLKTWYPNRSFNSTRRLAILKCTNKSA